MCYGYAVDLLFQLKIAALGAAWPQAFFYPVASAVTHEEVGVIRIPKPAGFSITAA